MANTYGYTRVSNTDQNEDRRILHYVKKAILDKNIFMDKQSRGDFN